MEPLSVANAATRTLSLVHYSERLLLIAISAISVVLLQNALSSWRAASVKWPPGPPAWPIIGHLHLLGHLPHQSLCKLAQTYGPLLGLRLGGVPVIVAPSPQMAKEILQTHDAALAYRPRTAAAVHVCFDSSDVAYAPLGPYWKFLRQVYATELFGPKKMDAFRYVREGEARGLVRAVLQRCGEGGAPVEAQVGSLHNLIEDVLHLLGVFYSGDYVPWLAWLDPHGYLKSMKVTAQRTQALLQGVIDERRQLHNSKSVGAEEKGPHDLLDVLLAASRTNEEVPMTDKHIMAAIQDVFVGGSDTSATSVEWALVELINHPKAMIKLHQEMDNVVGKGRLVEESDIPNLTYLEYVIKESMRLHPIAPFLIPREAKQECTIGGFKIFPGTHIYVNTWAIGRDSSAWEEPLQFLPERFAKKNIDLRGQHFDFLPFGMGRRRCPGWALGISNVRLMLATLIQAFTWHCVSETSQGILDMSEKFGLTVDMAKHLQAIATPRLPLHLY
ncbi:hypothetical protein GOP47_0007399 [Adiantum capillus-veneris]|uniref:Cytochrome P450 n=1 Tax=Adiantum capillus-veneris TaxID=13818 RepID=A0A9D4ZLW1_ADICA|nr:hypothetical protein GOP47_0007399 [Adiantum capillus-veneris]